MQDQVPSTVGLSALRPGPTRLATAAACLGLAVAVALSPLGSPSTPLALRWSIAFGVAGCVLAAAGLAGWSPGVGLAVLLLGAGYGLSLVGRGGTEDTGVIAVASALVAMAEFGYWSLDARGPAGSSGDQVRRAGLLLGLSLLALSAAGTVTLAVSLPDAGGFPVAAAGVAGAVGLLALLLMLARRIATQD